VLGNDGDQGSVACAGRHRKRCCKSERGTGFLYAAAPAARKGEPPASNDATARRHTALRTIQPGRRVAVTAGKAGAARHPPAGIQGTAALG